MHIFTFQLQPNHTNDTKVSAATNQINLSNQKQRRQLGVLVSRQLKRVWAIDCCRTDPLGFSLRLPGNQHQGPNCLSGWRQNFYFHRFWNNNIMTWKRLKARTFFRDQKDCWCCCCCCCWRDLGNIQSLFRICVRNPREIKVGFVSVVHEDVTEH